LIKLSKVGAIELKYSVLKHRVIVYPALKI